MPPCTACDLERGRVGRELVRRLVALCGCGSRFDVRRQQWVENLGWAGSWDLRILVLGPVRQLIRPITRLSLYVGPDKRFNRSKAQDRLRPGRGPADQEEATACGTFQKT
jgi:hypothetical protein